MLLIIKTLGAIIASTLVTTTLKGFTYECFYISLLFFELLSMAINSGKKSDFYYLSYTAAYTLTGAVAYFTDMPLLAAALIIIISFKRNHYFKRLINAFKTHKEREFNKELKKQLRTVRLKNRRTANSVYNAHFKNFFDYEQNKRSMYIYKDVA